MSAKRGKEVEWRIYGGWVKTPVQFYATYRPKFDILRQYRPVMLRSPLALRPRPRRDHRKQDQDQDQSRQDQHKDLVIAADNAGPIIIGKVANCVFTAQYSVCFHCFRYNFFELYTYKVNTKSVHVTVT